MLSRHRLARLAAFAGASLFSTLVAAPTIASAQARATIDSASWREHPALVTIGGADDDHARLRQLLGTSMDGYQFRSPSSMSQLFPSGTVPALRPLAPNVRMTRNTRLPYSLNDQALWAGRGTNLDIVAGAAARFGRVRIIVAPELTYSANKDYVLADPGIAPPIPSWRNRFASPWHSTAQSIDLPIRFGEQPLTRLTAGQSSLTVDAGPVSVGAATENEWWGPGIRNALLLSNNAAGFPHLFVRTARPIATRLGAVEARWLAGGLTESPHFDFDPANDLRSIAMRGVSLRPALAPNIVLGAYRSVFSATGSWGSALASFPQVFRDVGQPNAVPGVSGRTDFATDSAYPRGSDALIALSARWRFPASGLELYTEWARAEMPVSLRDFLVEPTHTEAYTYGLQWLTEPLARIGGRNRLQVEATSTEQSTTFRFRNIGSWYTSRTVEQGYTERGQVLGAAIGPGSSSQFIALDHLTPAWELGAHLTRIRYLQDVASYRAYEQDVSLLPGIRGRLRTSAGTFGLDYSSGWRLNVFLGLSGLAERNRDERNHSLTLTYSP